MIADWLAHLSTHMRLSMSATLMMSSSGTLHCAGRSQTWLALANNKIPSALWQALLTASVLLPPLADAENSNPPPTLGEFWVFSVA